MSVRVEGRGDPCNYVAAGPFASADEASRFVEAAPEPVHQPLSGYSRPLGRPDDWEPAALDGRSSRTGINSLR